MYLKTIKADSYEKDLLRVFLLRYYLTNKGLESVIDLLFTLESVSGNINYSNALKTYLSNIAKKRLKLTANELNIINSVNVDVDTYANNINNKKYAKITTLLDQKINLLLGNNINIQSIFAVGLNKSNATYETLSKIILKYENILDDFILYKNKLIIKRLTKVFEFILKTEFDESEFKKARYRKTEIFDILNCGESKTNKVNGVSVFGVPFEINVIKNTLISLGIDVDSVNTVNVENNTTKHVDTINNFEDFEDYDFYNTNNDLEESITKTGW